MEIETHPAARKAHEILIDVILSREGVAELSNSLKEIKDQKLRERCTETFKKFADPLPTEIYDLEILGLANTLQQTLINQLQIAILKVQKINGYKLNDCDLSPFEQLGLLLPDVKNRLGQPEAKNDNGKK